MTSLGNESTKLLLNQLINELHQNTISSKNYVNYYYYYYYYYCCCFDYYYYYHYY